MNIHLRSDAFNDRGLIPDDYVKEGRNISPRLHWEPGPSQTKSYALICDDPDAPTPEPFVHWVVYNIPAIQTALEKAIPHQKEFSNGTMQGENSYGNIRYDGPNPPSGTHSYFFKIYALDSLLKLPAGATKEEVMAALEGHVVGHGELEGKYSKQKQMQSH